MQKKSDGVLQSKYDRRKLAKSIARLAATKPVPDELEAVAILTMGLLPKKTEEQLEGIRPSRPESREEIVALVREICSLVAYIDPERRANSEALVGAA